MKAIGLYDPRAEHDACGVGFIVHQKGKKSHEIVQNAILILKNLEHRGACGAEPNTGDGAGILIQIPHAFLQKEFSALGIALPPEGQYGVGCLFLSQNEEHAHLAQKRLEEITAREGQKFLGWRDVPVDPSSLGNMAKEAMPLIKQFVIG